MVKGAKQVVEKLLVEIPDLRDNDFRLLANVYWLKVSEKLAYKLTPEEMEGVKKLLHELAEKRLPNFESVRRCRQKLQEERPELRGELYEQRHKQSREVKKDLRLW